MSVSIVAELPGGAHAVLATQQTETSPVAQCTNPGCPTSIQRTVAGTLADGVRAHYRTVHPERRVQ